MEFVLLYLPIYLICVDPQYFHLQNPLLHDNPLQQQHVNDPVQSTELLHNEVFLQLWVLARQVVAVGFVVVGFVVVGDVVVGLLVGVAMGGLVQGGAVGAEVESFGMFEVGISDVGRDVDGFDVGFGVGWDVVGFDVTTLQARAGVFSAAYS